MSNDKKLKVAIIGVGNIGSAHAAAIYSGKIPHMCLAALCDSDEQRLTALKQTYSDVPVFDSAQQLFDSGVAEAVVIATPHYLHPP